MATIGLCMIALGAIGMSLIALILSSELEKYMEKCEAQEKIINGLLLERKEA